jgi:hypothetical protein
VSRRLAGGLVELGLVERVELGLVELGLVELGLVELGLVELGLVELGLVELGPAEPGVAASGRCRGRASRSGSCCGVDTGDESVLVVRCTRCPSVGRCDDGERVV